MEITKEIYRERLLMLADHLDSEHAIEEVELRPIRLCEVEKGYNITYNVQVFQSVFQNLPAIFPEWYWDEETGEAKLSGLDPEMNSVYGVCTFFDLELEQLMHLFTVKNQKVHWYHGEVLTVRSTHFDIALNIVQFVRLMKIRNDL